jgi:DNA-binding beta-propeller fold protein YncE
MATIGRSALRLQLGALLLTLGLVACEAGSAVSGGQPPLESRISTPAAATSVAIPATNAGASQSESISGPTQPLPITATLIGALPGGPLGQAEARPTMPPLKVALVGWTDRGATPLDQPIAVAVDRRRRLYVVDAGNDRIASFDGDGRFLRAWGGPGDDAGRFRFHLPDRCEFSDRGCAAEVGGGVAVDDQDRVYVADYANHRVQQFDPAGRLLAVWGREGDRPGEFRLPAGIAVDREGRVYVADAGTGRVQVFDRAGSVLAQWSALETTAGQRVRPGALAVDAQGAVYIADRCADRVAAFDSRGQFVREWSRPGDVSHDCDARLPSGVAVDRRGTVYLAGSGPVQAFDWQGRALASWRQGWPGEGYLWSPAGVAVDEQGDVYVADSGKDRVLTFRLLAPATD